MKYKRRSLPYGRLRLLCAAPAEKMSCRTARGEEERLPYHLEKHFPQKGREYAEKLRDYTIALYKKCAEYALSRGIIIADTKFEYGLDEAGNIVLADEMLTPDSSRFWPAEGYEPGHGQPEGV